MENSGVVDNSNRTCWHFHDAKVVETNFVTKQPMTSTKLAKHQNYEFDN